MSNTYADATARSSTSTRAPHDAGTGNPGERNSARLALRITRRTSLCGAAFSATATARGCARISCRPGEAAHASRDGTGSAERRVRALSATARPGGRAVVSSPIIGRRSRNNAAERSVARRCSAQRELRKSERDRMQLVERILTATATLRQQGARRLEYRRPSRRAADRSPPAESRPGLPLTG